MKEKLGKSRFGTSLVLKKSVQQQKKTATLHKQHQTKRTLQNILQITVGNFVLIKSAIMSRSIDIETVTEVVDNLNSTDPKLVVKGLNILSKKTFELADSNAFLIDNFPSLHLAIGSLLDVIDPAGLVAFEKDDNVNKTWNSPLPTDYNMEFKVIKPLTYLNLLLIIFITLVEPVMFS